MLISRVIRVLEFFKTRDALQAAATWPEFSLSALSIVSRMKRAGVSPRTVIDVGANVGQFAVAAASLFKEITLIPIEPDPRVAAKLRTNLSPQVREHIIVTAVGDTTGTAVFHVNRDRQVSSLLELGSARLDAFPGSIVVEEIIVPVTTLDALFANRSLAGPILLKIDVQGFEDRVITGASDFLARVSWVLMEVSFSKLYEGERHFNSILELMASKGFVFVRPMNVHFAPNSDEIIEMDALFEAVPKTEPLSIVG